MAGNGLEWVADYYDADYYTTLGDETVFPTGPTTGVLRVVRGGSWFHDIGAARAPNRLFNTPEFVGNFVGVRCVVPVEE